MDTVNEGSVKIGRDDPCWCGSKKEFKLCHCDRHTMIALKEYEIDQELAKIHTRQCCLHPSAPDGCSPNIINGHTLQNHGQLNQIAIDGHVYGVYRRYMDYVKKKPPFQLIGLDKASTFRFFCSEHDNATFRPIETQPIEFTPEQCFLLGYRALCRDVYLAARVLEEIPLYRERDRGKPLAEQQRIQANVTAEAENRKLRLKVVQDAKVHYDAVLQKKTFGDIRFSRFEIEPRPDILVSSALLPIYDFAGTLIPQLPLTASLIALPGSGGALVFAWHKQHGETSNAFVDSLLSLPATDLPHAITRLAFSLENTFISPVWWESLPGATRLALENRFVAAMAQDDVSALKDDGLRAVNWTVRPIV